MTRRELELERDLAEVRAAAAERELETTTKLLEVERTAADGWRDVAANTERELGELRAELERGWRAHLRKRVVVNTTGGEGFRGLLFDADGPLLLLRDAELLGEGGKALPSPQPLDGEVIIELKRVAWVQVPTTAGDV